MPAIIAALWTGFLAILGSTVGQVLVSLGMAAVTYTGVDASLSFFKSMAVQHLTALPPPVFGMLGVLKVGQCVSMVCSAVVMRMSLSGFKSGSTKAWRITK
ncbi:MAG: DUF2523 domain-containing protein [Curvibacter sp.]|nr:MAG: DUF2523 domain-containing protein [Curvibacter sp.]